MIDDLVRGKTVFENATHRGLRARPRRRLGAVPAGQRRRRHGASGSRTCCAARSTCRTRPSSSCCGRRSAMSRRSGGTCRSSSTRSGRSCPSAGTRSRWRTSGTRATCAEAMRNYLMLLGWAPKGDREIVPWDEMVAEFRIEDVNPSPAFFDVKKLRAFNGEYIRAHVRAGRSSRPASRGWRRDAAPWPAERFDPAVFAELAPLAQTRVSAAARDHRDGGLRVPGRAGAATRRPGPRP